MTIKQRQILTELFGSELPGFVMDAGQTFLRVRFQDDSIRTIHVQDVLQFWEESGEHENGTKMFAGVPCDLREANFLAYMCHEYFKAVLRGPM